MFKIGKYKPETREELLKLVNNPKIKLSKIDVSKILDMSFLFSGNTRTDFSGINEWGTSNVIDMSFMFLNSKINIPISFNTSNVKRMQGMFKDCQIKNLPKWFK